MRDPFVVALSHARFELGRKIRALEIIRESQLRLIGQHEATLELARAERDAARRDRDAAHVARDAAAHARTSALAERDAARRERAEACSDRDRVRAEVDVVRRALKQAEERAAPWNAATTDKLAAQSALALAEVLFSGDLVVAKAAQRSAGDSGFRDGALVFRVLAVLAMCGRSKANVAEQIKLHFGERARSRPNDSKATCRTFRSERRVTTRDGQQLELGPHITLGGKNTADGTLQIYYCIDATGKVHILRCGRHTKTVSLNT